MAIQVGEWIPAPPAVATPEERLQMVARFLDPARTAEIALYAHGTVAVRVVGARLALDDIMRHYDVPFEGEGSRYGDINPTPIDDGSCLFPWPLVYDPWPLVYDGDQPQGGALYAAAASELQPGVTPDATSATEVFQVPGGLPRGLMADVTLLHAGLTARRARTLDAKELQRIAYWCRHDDSGGDK